MLLPHVRFRVAGQRRRQRHRPLVGPQQSFPLEESFSYVSPRNAQEAVEQSILYTPLFPTRWRWNATRALAIPRQRGGKRVPPFIQRLRADDLLAAVFPAQVGCKENATGPLEIPDHPLVRQAVDDCLREAMDIDGLINILERIEAGDIKLHARDTTEPSPMAHEIVNGRPYTYLDDAPLEERRTRAVTLRRRPPKPARSAHSTRTPSSGCATRPARPARRGGGARHAARPHRGP